MHLSMWLRPDGLAWRPGPLHFSVWLRPDGLAWRPGPLYLPALGGWLGTVGADHTYGGFTKHRTSRTWLASEGAEAPGRICHARPGRGWLYSPWPIGSRRPGQRTDHGTRG